MNFDEQKFRIKNCARFSFYLSDADNFSVNVTRSIQKH